MNRAGAVSSELLGRLARFVGIAHLRDHGVSYRQSRSRRGKTNLPGTERAGRHVAVAIERIDQCVASAGVDRTVRSITAAT